MSDFPNTSAGFREFFHTMRDQIHGTIRSLMEKLGGKVCFRMYHDCDLTGIRYTFYETDDDGFGRAMFLDTVEMTPEGDIDISLHDSEDCYEPVWCLEDMTVTDALYVLEELEAVSTFHENHPDKAVFTEYDPDFDWENY